MARPSAWRLADDGGSLVARCAALDAIPGLAHAVSTRRSHGADVDLLLAAGCRGSRPAILRQVHGNRIVRASDLGDSPVEADGVVGMHGDDPGTPVPAVRTADCAAVLLASRDGRAFAAVHAGWRGTAADIAREAVSALREAGSSPGTLVAAIGPVIGPCCYEVGDVVVRAIAASGVPAERFVRAGPAGRAHVDLHAALASQLVGCGVAPDAIHPAPWCTRCRNDLFFSFRAEGTSAGRLMAVVGRSASRP